MLIQRHKTIIDTKNISEFKSNTPIWILLKWERKDIEPIVSVIQTGAQDRTADKIKLKPAIIKTKPLIDEIINAITWFLVRVERQEVRAKKAPAINQLPIYDIKKPGLSKKTLEDVIEDFQENGINECINSGGYVKVPNFVVSATNVYVLTR